MPQVNPPVELSDVELALSLEVAVALIAIPDPIGEDKVLRFIAAEHLFPAGVVVVLVELEPDT